MYASQPLASLCTISKGKKLTEVADGQGAFKYLQIDDLHGTEVHKSTNEKSVHAVSSDVLIAWDGANAGKVGTGLDGMIGSTLARLRLVSDALTPRYLFWYLESQARHIKAQRTGATIPHVNGRALREMLVPLPPLGTQQRIADTLDAANAIRRKDQEMLGKYDDLAQSLYLSSFDRIEGNYVEMSSLCASSDDIRCGPFGTQLLSSEFLKEGVFLWGIKHVNRGFRVLTHEFLSIQKSQALSAYSIVPGDIVVTRKGTIGNAALYPEHLAPGVMHSDLLRIRVDRTKIDPSFLLYQLKLSARLKSQIAGISVGAIMAGINVGKLKKLLIESPTIEAQRIFKSQLDRIHAAQDATRKSQEQSTHLFENLLSQYFG